MHPVQESGVRLVQSMALREAIFKSSRCLEKCIIATMQNPSAKKPSNRSFIPCLLSCAFGFVCSAGSSESCSAKLVWHQPFPGRHKPSQIRKTILIQLGTLYLIHYL